MTNFDETEHPRATDGKFAAKPAGEAQVALIDLDRRPEPRQWSPQADTDTVDRVAALLGRDDSWDGSADYLEDIADTVAATGRPHPGDADPDTYMKDLVAWADEEEGRGRAGKPSRDTNAMNRIALRLGQNPDWGADDLDEVARIVARTGRPAPGSVDGDDYQQALTDWCTRQNRKAGLVESLHDGTPATAAVIETMVPAETGSEDELVADAQFVAGRLADSGRAPGLTVTFEKDDEEGYVSFPVSNGQASTTRGVGELHADTRAKGTAAAAQYAEQFMDDFEALVSRCSQSCPT